MRFLMLCVTLIFISYGLASFFVFQNLLNTDYSNKITFFAQQQAKNGASYLRMAENNMNLFLIQHDPTKASFNSFHAHAGLRHISSISLDLRSAFFVVDNSLYLNPQQTNDFLSDLNTLKNSFDISDEDFKWYYLESDDVSNDLLMCIKTIPDYNDNPFTLGVLLPASNIIPYTSNSTESTGIFSKSNFSASIQCTPESFLHFGDNTRAQTSHALHAASVNSDILTQTIDGSPFVLCLQVSREGLNTYLLLFFFGIMILCGFLTLVAYVTLRHFLKRVTSALEALYLQFSLFSDLREETKPFPIISEATLSTSPHIPDDGG